MTVEERLQELEDMTAYVVSDVDVFGTQVVFCVDAPPDISLFTTAEQLGIDVHSVSHLCYENVYQCRALVSSEGLYV